MRLVALFLTLVSVGCHTPWALRSGLQAGLKEAPGATYRSDTAERKIFLMFTGHEFADGGDHIARVLQKHHIRAYFFFTGEFIRLYPELVKTLHRQKHYLGPHSDQHLLYCDWVRRDSLLVTEHEFKKDLLANIQALKKLGIRTPKNQRWFMPPYEWYNDQIQVWTRQMGWTLINFTPGTGSNADYTTPEMPNYRSSATILEQLWAYERIDPQGLNGFHLLIHIGTDPRRSDKLYGYLDDILQRLKSLGYRFS